MNTVRGIPERIFGYYNPQKCLDIRYDKAVQDKDKIPGLVEFLNYEYELLLKSRGRFIFDDDLFEKDMQPIPVILSSECPKDKRYRMNDDWVARAIVKELQKGYTEAEKEGVVKMILWRSSFKPSISGKYFHSGSNISKEECGDIRPEGPYIELYYRNTACYYEDDYKAWLVASLAHEYYHFLHDSYAREEFNKGGWRRDRIKESLADFFSFSYCLSRAEAVAPDFINSSALKRCAKSQFNSWQYRFGSKWPYAFAYCFFYGNDTIPMDYSNSLDEIRKKGCVEKFNIVLGYSKNSMNRAYRELTYNVSYI